MKSTHVLNSTVGVRVTFEIDLEDPAFFVGCTLSRDPRLLPHKQRKRFSREYLSWRDDLVQEAAQKSGKRIAVVGGPAGFGFKVFSPKEEVA